MSSEMTSEHIAHLLGRWTELDGPLYRKLARAIQQLLEAGQLDTGANLPAERRLAAALAVSRNTVAAAYRELRVAGWVDARRGSSTRITASRYSPVGGHRANALFATMLQEHPDVMDLTIAVPDPAPIVGKVLSTPTDYVDAASLAQGHGYNPKGNATLRGRLATILTLRGLPTDAEQLVLTTGAQQAISIAIRALSRPGDLIGVEEVTFPGALDAISVAGARPVGIAVGPNGLDLDGLATVVAQDRPRLLYLIPTFHNPSGALLSVPDRRRVARLIAEAQITTIDDVTLSDLDYGTQPPPPLAAYEPDAPIITIGSMSKVFWGGLRIGWMRASEPVASHLAGLKTTADLGGAATIQVLAAAMLAEYEQTRAWRNEQLIGSLRAFSEALAAEIGEWRWHEPLGGPHLWIQLPGTDALAFSQRLLRNGVAVVAGPLLSFDASSARDRIRVPFYRPPADLERAVERMAVTWRDRGGSRPR